MKFISKNIGFIVAGIVVLGGLYWYFFSGSEDIDASLTSTPAASPLETRFLTLSGELDPISFDTQIFSDSRFLALINLTTEITAEPQGRADPFAPLSSSGSSAAAKDTSGI